MNRDRFVLSAGHASTLLYTVLHLAKVKAVDPEYEILGRPSVTLDDLKSFRQFGSRCAGHPEYRWTSGVETTTGPLGQGVATSVGMAIAQKWLAARYNRPDFELFNYRIYALNGDGCMMEGISSEAASLAAHLKLDNPAGSTTTITSPSRARRTSHSLRMWPDGFWRTAGMCFEWEMPTTSVASRTRSRRLAKRREGRRSLLSIAISGTVHHTAKERALRTESRLARKKSG